MAVVDSLINNFDMERFKVFFRVAEEEPDDPENPDEPENPDSPDDPDSPETPDNPDNTVETAKAERRLKP